MKHLSVFLITFLFSTAFWIENATASPLATFNYKVFHVPDRGPVVETYVEIVANSVSLNADADGKLSGQVQLTLIFKQDSAIITFDKKTIDSPKMDVDHITDFLDVQRFSLAPGTYSLEILLKDMKNPEASVQEKTVDIMVPALGDGVSISDLELVSGIKKTETPGIFSKSGYDLIPLVNDTRINQEMNELILYAEVYGTPEATSGKYLVRTYLESVNDFKPVESTFKLTRMEAKEVNPVLLRIPVTNLPKGDYNIVLEARSAENELLAQRKMKITRLAPAVVEFTDVNDQLITDSWVAKYDNKAVLFDFVKSLRPTAGLADRRVIDHTFRKVEDSDLKLLQQYFYSFWREKDPENPEQAWLDYHKKVLQADKEFGSQTKRGYETDQGRVYLQYGAPDDIADRPNEPSTYPYRIWRYYNLDGYNNVKFVFYDPQRIGNDYQLLHSENIRGEITNYRWKLMLETPSFPQHDLDRTNTTDQFGRQVDDLYENPR